MESQSPILKENLRRLTVRHPELAQTVAQQPSNGGLEVIASKAGPKVARVPSAVGEPVLLASEYDPQTEAKRFIEAQLLDEREAYVVLGCGMGYHLLEILRHLGKEHYFLVVEKSLSVFRAALENVDFSELFDSGKFSFFCGDNLVDLSAWYTTFIDQTFQEDITVVRHTPSFRVDPTFYGSAVNELQMAANRRVVDLATSMAWSQKFQGNILGNVLNTAAAGGVGPLAGALHKVPAIIVAAGPSLDKNIEQLKRAKGRALIITVGTSLKKVIGAGTQPDVVVAMDPTDLSHVYFQGATGLDNVTLVADPEIYPQILDEFPGGKLVIDIDTPVTNWLRPFLGDKGTMMKGRTVAHTSFFFARHLGCDPITFIGLDLALTGGKIHADQCNEGWGDDLEAIKPGDPKYTWIDAADGGTVPTMSNFLNFLTIFETEVAKTDALCIDATEGGALKRGMKQMRLEQVIDTYCQTEQNIPDALKKAWDQDCQPDLTALLKEVQKVHTAMGQILRLGRQGDQLIDKIATYLDTHGYHAVTLKPLLTKVNDLHNQANLEVTAMSLIHRHLVNARIFFQSRAVRKIEEMEVGKERLTHELARSKKLLTDTLTAAEFLDDALASLKQRIEDRLAHPPTNTA